MIVYDKTLLDNSFLVAEANLLADSGFINTEKAKAITKEMVGLKTNDNLVIRIMMFLLGCFLYGSICGFIALLTLDGLIDSHWEILILLFALIGFLGQEFVFAKSSNMHGYGLDDAAILGALLASAFFVVEISDRNNFTISAAIALLSIFTYLRYLHTPSVIIACLSVTSSLFLTLMDFCQYGQQIMPFMMLLFAGFVYFLSENKLKNHEFPYYQNGLFVLKTFGLVLFYLAGNYFVVRELSFSIELETLQMNDPYPTESSEIPMAWLFYGFTIVTPSVYLVFSLLKKDKILLWVGLLSLCLTVFTIRFYHSVMPLEVALTLAGIVLFAIAYFSIRKLKNKESGITFMPDKFESSNSLLQLETIASAAQFGLKPEIKVPDSSMEFGGGGFSGGGGGGNY